MKLAVVTGYVVCTVRHEGLAHDKHLLTEMLGRRPLRVLSRVCPPATSPPPMAVTRPSLL